VHVIVVGGNHDRLQTFQMGRYLKAWFRKHPGVKVDTLFQYRKYIQYGQNLIGLSHGDGVKPDTLVTTMAAEAPPEMWASTRYRELWTGHLHFKKKMLIMLTDTMGVYWRQIPSTASPDDWHKYHAFIGSRKGAEVCYYDKQDGPAGEFPVYVDTIAEPAALAA
jgi:hypothetical protein